MKSIFLAIFILFCTNPVIACEGTDYEWARTLNSEKHTVKGPYTIEQLEKNHMIEIRETKKKVPFGYINEEWEKLKSMYKEGDQFYFVRFQDGRFFMEHHVLVRGSCIIGALRGAIS